jgi:hypothetical protein
MISEARAPGPDDTGPNRDISAEIINVFIDNFSFVGMNPDGSTRIVGVHTMRDAVFMSGADSAEDSVHFNAGTRVVRVDPARDRAVVTDVVHPPLGRRKGMVRSYVIDGYTGTEPHVSWTGDDQFEARSAFGFNPPDEGYIKVYYPSVIGQWDGSEATRLMRSGQMDSAQWLAFSMASRVEAALQLHDVVLPDEI